MPGNITELPTEVLETMAKRTGTDTTQAPQELPVSSNDIDATVQRLTKENGNIGQLTKLLRQRMNYNDVVKQLNNQQITGKLQERAKANRRLLVDTFLKGR